MIITTIFSKSVYPSVDLPSLLIKITVRFLDTTADHNLTSWRSRYTSNVYMSKQTEENTCQTTENEAKTYKFTWSASCLYVSGGDISLTSMNVFSL